MAECFSIFTFEQNIRITFAVSIRKTSDAHELHQVMRMSCIKRCASPCFGICYLFINSTFKSYEFITQTIEDESL